MPSINQLLALFLKGAAMGAANVIPGVSGGTIAFITGIYEDLLKSIKSFNMEALQLALKFKVKEFIEHTNLYFLIAVFAGIGASILSLAKLLEWLFEHYEVLTMSFFFGLIVASIYMVGKAIQKWNLITVLMFLIGTAIAVSIAFLTHAGENDGFAYLFVCGIVAICSMILPGLSGSYILLLMGNYFLVLRAVSEFNFSVIIPLGLGCVFGLIAFSYILTYLFNKFRDGTIAVLTGFVLGSLVIIWPWKNTITDVVMGKEVELGYEWFMPEVNGDLLTAVLVMAVGVVAVLGIDYLGRNKDQELQD